MRLQASAPSADLRVDYLVKSKWGQSGHGENYYTPGSAVCGCVATMGSQVMRFWQYPTASITKTAQWYGSCNYSGTKKGWDVDGYDASASAAQADWLNAFPSGHDAVASRIKSLTVRQFSDAYLLNLDLMQDFGYGFGISGISDDDEKVTVGVTLVRTNALATAGINGTLKLYGGKALGGITNFLDTAQFDDAKFTAGDSAQAEFAQDGTNTFFKAVIE